MRPQILSAFLGIYLGLIAVPVIAAEYHGQVRFGGLPVPGATVTARQGEQTSMAVTDPQGAFSIADLADGVWSVEVEMLGFATLKQDVTIPIAEPAPEWELKLLSFDEIKAITGPAVTTQPSISYTTQPPAAPQNTAVPAPLQSRRNKKAAATRPATSPPATGQNSFQRTDLRASNSAPAANSSAASEAVPANSAFANQDANELNQRASDGFLINGTVSNGAASPFAQAAAFGNNRRGPGSLYNGTLGFTLDNSALDARPFSLTGQDTARPPFNHIQAGGSFGGPIRIGHFLKNPPVFFVSYQLTRNRNASTQTALVPTVAQRNGDFSGIPQIFDVTGAPIAANLVPASLISPQAKALLAFYPLPNFDAAGYNYQIPIVGVVHQDAIQGRLNKSITNRDQANGTFSFQRGATETPNLFGFADRTSTHGVNLLLNWQHRITPRTFGHLSFQYSRFSTRVTPNFANRENVSGEAGISGNNQEAVNWGPPNLSFASGIAGLWDAQSSFNRNQTASLGYDSLWNHGRHNISYGADYRRFQFNYLGQENPRGSFSFTGAATRGDAGTAGSDFADFLLGVPDTSSIAFGNADKYFRTAGYDAFATDDWRVGPALTVSAGVRWEYGGPMTELYGRLVSLDVASGFASVVPVVANHPAGALTGQKYPDSLVQPDKHDFAPRIGIAWRPLPASSLVVRAGYGVYFDTAVYQPIALQMAQQSPLSRSLSVQNTPANPLTLASGFNVAPGITPTTFAVDPNFRVGYSQNWQLSVQRDLPQSFIVTATYLGIKGTRGKQEFLPNTFPAGAVNPCPACPTGFAYLTSNGNSTRESGQVQLRRRLHNGLTATLQYVYSKSIDDSSLGGRGQGSSVIAQNWLDLSAERGLSSFDQRHLLTFQGQYTTGMGIGGGTLVSGWRGALFKEWTTIASVNAGTGLPLTPVYFTAVPGTGVTGPVRPDYTGAPLYSPPPGFFLNPGAYAQPTGHWGNAGRNSITGPSQFTFNASLSRTFRLKDRYSLDLRVDSNNPLNHVTFPGWNTTFGSPQFGLPYAANSMRSLQTTLRVRF